MHTFRTSFILALCLLTLGFSGCQKLTYTPLADVWVPNYDINRFEQTIVAYEQNDPNTKSLRNAIVLTGSSSFALWKTADKDLAPLPIINRGFGGSTFPEVLHYLERSVLVHNPKSIVVYCENDMFMGKEKSAEQTRDAYVALVKVIKEKSPTTKIFYVSMKPSPLRWKDWEKVQKANQLIKDFIKKDRLQEYIDITNVMLRNGRPDPSIFLSDSLHMNDIGYSRWIPILKRKLQ